jgi:transporter family protein
LVASTLAYGIWGFGLKKAALHLHPLIVQMFVAATGFLLIIGYVVAARLQQVPLTSNAEGLKWGAGAGVMSAAGSLLLLFAMQKGASAAGAVAMTSAYPAVTLVLGALFLGEEISASKMAGIAAICVGAVLLSR